MLSSVLRRTAVRLSSPSRRPFASANMGLPTAQTIDTSARLAALRQRMSQPEYSVDAVVVPSEDQHYSEYIAECDMRRAFISGFNGSAGCAIVTTNDAFLFTDGRYFLQAEQQLDENWTLMKQGLPDVPTWQDFLYKNLEKNCRIGVDPTLITASDADAIQKTLQPRNSQLVSLRKNVVDSIWTDRPPRPVNRVFPLDLKYSGESHITKIGKLREELAKRKLKAVVVNMLDEVAWLFNLRGSDIDYNPVFFAYAVITSDKALLFVDLKQVDAVVTAHLGDQIVVKPYDSFFSYLEGLGAELGLSKDAQVLVSDKTSLAIVDAIGADNITVARSLVADLKSIKNTTEIEGFRQCHIRDGAALVRYFAWLEEQLSAGAELTESQVADQLEQYRSELDLFKGLSFPTISSTGPNGAIIHYTPDPVSSAIVRKDQIYLCDSGGQYLDGTTDVTRTLHFGTPTTEEKRAYTRVLQGHIAIDTAVFPSGTSGYLLDAFARRPLWEDGLDYRHGTGHGVGHFLNVHEGPHGIGVRIVYNNTPLKAGMTVSNEPGFYADGKFGIRIESVVIVRPADTLNNFGDKGYLGFEHVTMCPIQKSLVDMALLTVSERKWLDAYHAEVLEKVAPLLQNDSRALAWLLRECTPL
ncbi:Creatinase/aminopeptidase [Amylocystis lapponica]|nr:Creatinase/aminopeptidase [Amylocystis lapponica]